MMFDQDDEQHREVVGILNGQGRKVARFVARAVIAYKYGSAGYGNAADLSECLMAAKVSSGEPVNDGVPQEIEEEYRMGSKERELLRNTASLFRKRS